MVPNSDAKGVLFFGDSNTEGHFGRGPNYFPEPYPVIVQKRLGSGYEIIQAGLGGRTMGADNPYGFENDGRNGLKVFSGIFGQYKNLALVSIMLGTNDANDLLRRSPEEIAEDLHEYFKIMGRWAVKYGQRRRPVLVMAPPKITDALAEHMYGGGEEITSRLAPHLERVTLQYPDAYFFDAGSVVSTNPAEGPADGVHINAAGHIALGEAVACHVQSIVEGGPFQQSLSRSDRL